MAAISLRKSCVNGIARGHTTLVVQLVIAGKSLIELAGVESSQLELLRQLIRTFASERDWDQFHNPKNLVMALAGEAGELTEIFQWLTPSEAVSAMGDPARAEAIRDELADTFYYLLRSV